MFSFSAFCSSPPGSYTQEAPSRKPYEKSVFPPVLPPHLLEVILNKDVSLNVSFSFYIQNCLI